MKSKVTDELIDAIMEDVATSHDGMTKILKKHGLGVTRFYEVINENDDWAKKYARAKELQMEFFADEIMEISDDSSGDTQTNEDGKEIVNHEHIQRSKLRVDTRKWLMSKLAPKKYGEAQRIDLNTSKQDLPDYFRSNGEGQP
jgi:hypothetical protein